MSFNERNLSNSFRGFYVSNQKTIVILNIVPQILFIIMFCYRQYLINSTSSLSKAYTDSCPANSSKKQLTLQNTLIQTIFGIFYLNIFFMEDTSSVEQDRISEITIGLTHLIGAVVWFLNRKLLSFEKRRGYPQSKLTHRWFWPVSFLSQVFVLVWMTVFQSKKDLDFDSGVLFSVEDSQNLTQIFEIDGTFVINGIVVMVNNCVLCWYALFNQDDFGGNVDGIGKQVNFVSTQDQEIKDQDDKFKINIPYTEKIEGKTVYSIEIEQRYQNIQQCVKKTFSEFKELDKNFKKVKSKINFNSDVESPILPDKTDSIDKIELGIKKQLEFYLLAEKSGELIFFPKLSMILIDFLDIKEKLFLFKDFLKQKCDKQITPVINTNQLYQTSVNSKSLTSLIKLVNTSKHQMLQFDIQINQNNIKLEPFIQGDRLFNNYQLKNEIQVSQIEEAQYELKNQNKNSFQEKSFVNFPSNVNEENTSEMLKCMSKFKFGSRKLQQLISGREDFTNIQDIVIDKLTEVDKNLINIIEVSQSFEVIDIEYVNKTGKAQFLQYIQVKKINKGRQISWVFNQRFSSFLMLEEQYQSNYKYLTNEKNASIKEQFDWLVVTNYSKALSRIGKLKSLLNQVYSTDKTINDKNLLEFIKDPEWLELKNILEMSSTYYNQEVLDTSFDSEEQIEEQVNRCSSLMFTIEDEDQ